MPAVYFLKKELRELVKTYKILTLPAVFLFFGLLGPITAKFLPDILKSLSGQNGIYYDPSKLGYSPYIGAYDQFFQNLNQIGFIIMILMFMGIVAGEKVKGSATLVLTKSLSRPWFIIDKFFSAVILFTLSFILGSAACIYYTYLLFPAFYNTWLIPGLFFLWLYGIFIISVVIFSSTLARSYIISAVMSFIIFIALSSFGLLPKIGEYSPSFLGGIGTA
ncbi:MAG: hypothetical protein Q8920_15380, partial [Bacillota bacterium]|nr:hypothetical protein [Bacillota bacterium]